MISAFPSTCSGSFRLLVYFVQLHQALLGRQIGCNLLHQFIARHFHSDIQCVGKPVRIGAAVAALVVVFAIIVVLMAGQLRQILRNQAELAQLSEKHARAAEAAARDLISWAVRCDITPAARARIGSAVAEIVTNSVEAGATIIEVEATMGARALEVEIRVKAKNESSRCTRGGRHATGCT